MLSNASLNDVCNMLQSRCVLLHAVVTQCDVVGQIRTVPQHLHGSQEFLARDFVASLFEEETAQIDLGVWVIGRALLHKTLIIWMDKDFFLFF